MSSASKKNEPRHEYPFSMKSTMKQTSSRIPNRGPYEGSCPFMGSFLHIPQIPRKDSPRITKASPFSKFPKKKVPLHVSQQQASMKTEAHFKSVILYTLRGHQ
jgi:hypothetical protein